MRIIAASPGGMAVTAGDMAENGWGGKADDGRPHFVRIHQTLRNTPAMAAGASATLWELEDMVKVLEEWEAAQ